MNLPDDASISVRDALAEGGDLRGASPLDGVLEINVLCHPDFSIEQCGSALIAELLPGLLQTPNYPGRALYEKEA